MMEIDPVNLGLGRDGQVMIGSKAARNDAV